MGTIKMFNGANPPLLKNGEWASNGIYAYLGIDNGDTKIFQSVFDHDKNQIVAGFEYDRILKRFVIPTGTPLSRVQSLIDSLPKSVKLKSGDSFWGVNIDFENSEFLDDMLTPLTIRDFTYTINLRGHINGGSILNIERSIEVRNSMINIYRLNVRQLTNNAYLFRVKDSLAYFNMSGMAQESKYYFIKDEGNNKIYLSSCTFVNSHSTIDTPIDVSFIFYAITPYSEVRVYTQSEDNLPNYICMILYGQLKVSDMIGAKQAYRNIDINGTYFKGSFDNTQNQLPESIVELANALTQAEVVNVEFNLSKNKVILDFRDGTSRDISLSKSYSRD
ncbi:hypothetical protein [Carboxylicivirga sp. N1Y90]|uniref:hypothetical protein n=1 Tax=Carboxylicivirga fragile TaxID=3417571 RepID=UPI003D349428|nr:hypothetical protein [Marinilabiliaceae bacterium N1Y90]